MLRCLKHSAFVQVVSRARPTDLAWASGSTMRSSAAQQLVAMVCPRAALLGSDPTFLIVLGAVSLNHIRESHALMPEIDGAALMLLQRPESVRVAPPEHASSASVSEDDG